MNEGKPKRRWGRIALGGVVLFLGIVAAGRVVQLEIDTWYDGVREPYLQSAAPDAVTLRWQTPGKGIGRVRYGTAPGALDREVTGAGPTREHELRLTGLRPGTRYWYALDQDGAPFRAGDEFWFFTPPAPGEGSARFLVLGDPGQPGQGAQRVRDAALRWVMQAPRPGRPTFDFVISNGDSAYTSGRNREYQAAIFDIYGALLQHVPIWPAYGNHDSRRRTYFEIFTLPERGEAGGVPSGTENYYSFDHGPVHVLVLDSEASDLEPGSAMLDWAARDLEATRAPWVVAVVHHPPYTKGTHDSDRERDSGGRMGRVREWLLPVLERGGVDLVIAGHSHMYERSALLRCHYGSSTTWTPGHVADGGAERDGSHVFRKGERGAQDGALHVVLGSSSKVDQGPMRHPALPVGLLELGALVIDAGPGGLEGRFVNDAGVVRDAFRIERDAGVARAVATCPAA